MLGQIPRFSRLISLPMVLLCLVAVDAARAQDTTILPQAQVGKPYSISIGVDTENGKGQFTWKLAHGDLPPGLQVSLAGRIEGTPAETKSDPYIFDLNVSDSSQPPQSAVLRFSMVIVSAPLRIKAVNVAATQLRILGVSAVGAVPSPATSASAKPAIVPSAVLASGPATPPSAARPVAPQITPPATPTSRAATDDDKQWEARAIVGFHQAGASSAKFTQDFFFDFFIMRALSDQHLWEDGARWNLWGDARIASAPQQVSTGVGTFATNFATQVSNLPVNQLAQSADFQTGLEYRLHTWRPDHGYRMAGLVGYIGAMGVFQPPDAQMEIFNVPDKTSLQYTAFALQFPSAANAKYVGFVPPNRERFYRNYGFGVRLTTFDRDQPLAAPATYTLLFGQDELITGGHLQSVIGKIDVFYPLPISKTGGAYKFVYLFGNANLRLSKATSIPTFALQNPNANGVTVQPFDPNLAIITVPSKRDTYRIGAGIDLVNLIQTIQTKGKVPATP
jgi:hypothetical protein